MIAGKMGMERYSVINEKALAFLNQEEIISYDYELNCNTLYLDLNLEESVSINNAKALLVRISSYYKSINYNIMCFPSNNKFSTSRCKNNNGFSNRNNTFSNICNSYK